MPSLLRSPASNRTTTPEQGHRAEQQKSIAASLHVHNCKALVRLRSHEAKAVFEHLVQWDAVRPDRGYPREVGFERAPGITFREAAVSRSTVRHSRSSGSSNFPGPIEYTRFVKSNPPVGIARGLCSSVGRELSHEGGREYLDVHGRELTDGEVEISANGGAL
jgi:hypothetical protein